MKAFLISLVLPKVIDLLIDVLEELADRTSTEIDDKMVEEIKKHKDQIMSGIKRRV